MNNSWRQRLMNRFGPAFSGMDIATWADILKENAFDIDLGYLPRALSTTFQSPDNSRVVGWERRRYGPLLKEKMYAALFRDQPLIPSGRYMEMRFSDLEQNPLAELERVYQTLHLPTFEAVRERAIAYLSSLRSYQKNRHPALEPEVRARIREEWSMAFERWGYEP